MIGSMREEQHLGEEEKKKMTGLIERMMHPWLTDATCEINPLAGSLGIRRSKYSQGHPTTVFGKYLFERRFEI